MQSFKSSLFGRRLPLGASITRLPGAMDKSKCKPARRPSEVPGQEDVQAFSDEPIMVIEDNPGDVYLLRESLKSHGLTGQLQVLPDGESALHFIDRLDADASLPLPAVVILDLNLPKTHGHQVLEHLRRSPRCAALPVIVLSSSDAPADRQKASECGASRYIRKPTDLDEFLQVGSMIRAVLSAAS